MPDGLDRIVYEHVRREQNKDADRLANLAMDEGMQESRVESRKPLGRQQQYAGTVRMKAKRT